jgi:hypothetical protein
MLRNQEKPQTMRDPHQLTPGPEHHRSIPDVALAYTNLLEERI